MIRLYLVSFLLIVLSSVVIAQDCQLFPPGGLYVSGITTCSATLHWKSKVDVKKYTVFYKLNGTSQWSSGISTGMDTFYMFTGLLAGKKYDFGVRSKCSDGSVSPIKQKTTKTLDCMLPQQVSIVPLTGTSVKISVQSYCPYSSLHVRYSTLNGPPVIKSFTFASSYQIGDLNPDSAYIFEVSTCKLQFDTWTEPDTVFLQPPPNIVLILVDDSRFDYYSCNGAFPFVNTPNIDRIANEGVNFKRAFVATSRCAPSRATIATGLFTLNTGVLDNTSKMDSALVTIPEVLDDYGYYNALVGKNAGTFMQGLNSEFDYSLAAVGDDEDIYNQTQFNYNGVVKTIEQPSVLTMTDTAIALIERVNQPLFLWLAYLQPHYPEIPLPSYDGQFDNYNIPWMPDTAKYFKNYPSFIYQGRVMHGEELDTTYRNIAEVVAGLDSCIGEVFNVLENTGKLNNTLIIFLSDNGYMLGTHWLDGKTYAYEPSMRTPLFARYPKWFNPGTVITSRFATNMDIAPTIYEAAQAQYNGPIDGKSLRDLYTGEFNRSEVYYLMLHNGNVNYPSKRAIRDKSFKYITYSCDADTVEELFDMVHDSLELTNLVNNQDYNGILNLYRSKFDSMKLAWQDTVESPLKDCYLKNPFVLKQMIDDAEYLPMQPMIYPTITHSYVEVFIPWNSASAVLYNSLGELVETWKLEETYSHLTLPELPEGVYYLNLRNDKESFTRELIITSE